MTAKEQYVSDCFPSSLARAKADKAIDELPESAPMTAFIDRWLEVYRAEGGIVTKARRR